MEMKGTRFDAKTSLVCEDVLGTTCTWLVEAIGQHNHLRNNLDMIVDQVHNTIII